MDPFSATSPGSASPAKMSYRDRVSTPPHPPSLGMLVRRLGRNGAIVLGLVVANLAIGTVGYHAFAGLPWLDATLNAAMILTGMGPVDRLVGPEAKVFAIVYSLFSAVFFLTMVAVLLAPAVQHFLHRFHLELDERRDASHRHQTHGTTAPGASCSLPIADRAQRTADFRALLADAFRDRTRSAGSVQWMLRASESTEVESRRLAALEARCCDGVRFHVERRGDDVLWTLTGQPTAQGTLDAFYQLPVLVRSDDGARALWDALDGAACGPSAGSRRPPSHSG